MKRWAMVVVVGVTSVLAFVQSSAPGAFGDTSQGGASATETPAGPSSDWSAVTAADFNADGMSDILWFNSVTGRMTVWLMEGAQLLVAGAELPGPAGDGWAAVQAGDLNQDGMADVVWYNSTTGKLRIWLMEGTHLLAEGPEIQGPPGSGWLVPSVADFNRDGMQDVLLYSPSQRRVAVWLMNGAQLLAPGPLLPMPDRL